MRLAAAFAALCLVAVGPAFAQETTPQEESTEVEGVVITGARLRELAREFVVEATESPRGRNPARWDGRVCIGVVNLRPEYAQALVDQVSAVAMVVGLEPGDPGCRPRILILADSDGDRLAQWMVDDSPQSFRPDLGSSNLGRDALRRFQTSGAPVRWWHVTGAVSTVTGGTAGGAYIQGSDVPRIRRAIEERFSHTIIILDTSRIGEISFASLADYISMIALSQVDDDADMAGFDSVLNLFGSATGEPQAGQRMTDWDLDILRALYAARGDGAGRRQEREIAWELEDIRQDDAERREEEAAAADEDTASEP